MMMAMRSLCMSSGSVTAVTDYSSDTKRATVTPPLQPLGDVSDATDHTDTKRMAQPLTDALGVIHDAATTATATAIDDVMMVPPMPRQVSSSNVVYSKLLLALLQLDHIHGLPIVLLELVHDYARCGQFVLIGNTYHSIHDPSYFMQYASSIYAYCCHYRRSRWQRYLYERSICIDALW